jgi:hypothetical protein
MVIETAARVMVLELSTASIKSRQDDRAPAYEASGMG